MLISNPGSSAFEVAMSAVIDRREARVNATLVLPAQPTLRVLDADVAPPPKPTDLDADVAGELPAPAPDDLDDTTDDDTGIGNSDDGQDTFAVGATARTQLSVMHKAVQVRHAL